MATLARVGTSTTVDSATASTAAATAALADVVGAVPSLGLVFATSDHDHRARRGRAAATQWGAPQPSDIPGAQLVMVFGEGARVADAAVLAPLAAQYPGAVLFGCSTAGEIAGTVVSDDTVVATALQFSATDVRLATTEVAGESDSYPAGQRLGTELSAAGLTHVFVLSDGLTVNGSQLAEGMAGAVGPQVVITGGLAGDGTNFARTYVVAGREARSGVVAAVGLYGSRLRVGCASLGGWDSFGPERLVTHSRGNVLFELDGQSALALYQRYLGGHARDLPASGLLFPLAVRPPGDDEPIVRTILSVDGSGPVADLRRRPAGGLLQASMTGFYSYGELSPFTPSGQCRLHNQTMTITTLSEA